MAFGDYHTCDNCGAQKTFYDANHNLTEIGGQWRYDAIPPHLPGYRVWALCSQCEKTHEIVVRPKETANELDRLTAENVLLNQLVKDLAEAQGVILPELARLRAKLELTPENVERVAEVIAEWSNMKFHPGEW